MLLSSPFLGFCHQILKKDILHFPLVRGGGQGDKPQTPIGRVGGKKMHRGSGGRRGENKRGA